ncbi:hypothetical protein AJ80_05307 [Polytolypa hystricis UAMH7299]|uniref:Endonuclease GajA/Old nuclease/RecF-like AAA domain-containing protein n=1 Tax=Polytolypa hystricis (strain UAMH7299) TaxID=1447883 RepID=A0A2B7Y5D1_POLH7|nr:hypothetical protein AJ80_05307 [Polytolypa hystricis UAMH7299]
MAPIKRSLAVAEGEAHSTAPNSSQRKRVRTSNVLGGRDDDSDSDASSPLDSSSFDADDSEAEALLEERATQIIREKFSRQEENVPAENGIIEKVECRNFMCHEHFDVDLGPLINFIVGKNGSGKSAILTALTLCLGGKASSTNRGQSLKNFIKEGQDSATIIVHIKNQGDNAYLPNEYGDSIIVERYFSRHGTSGFKLRSKSGRIVSHKKADLDMITDYYALQIDNPMNILSQDMARQFLSTSSPAEKYKFFVKGVQLEQLDQDYRLMEDSIDQAVAKMDQHREQMKALEAVKDKADRKLKVSERHEGLREKIRNLRGQAAWAQVEEQERIRDSYDDEIALMAQKLTALDGEIEAADQHFEDAERELEAATRTVQEATSEFDGIKDERQEIQERYDSSLAKRHEIQAEQRSVRELIKSAESRFNETQQNIVAQQQRLAESDDGTNARRRAELEEKKVMAGELHQRYESHQKNRTNLLNDRDSAEKKFQSAGGPISKQRGDLQQAEIQLQTLIRNKGQQQNGFPEKMPTLLRAIQQEKSFSRPPVGPLGRHVRLLKPKWSPILETSFGGSLSAFVVTSRADMNILSRIMERVSWQV